MTTNFVDQEPTPAVARRGQLLIHSGAMLHSAWHNPATEPRKAYLLQWVRRSVCRPAVPGLHGFPAYEVAFMYMS
jgi:ectoine hydroxylase-related dioxygenase (phytanoyl-CoA dioxygenase family)